MQDDRSVISGPQSLVKDVGRIVAGRTEARGHPWRKIRVNEKPQAG